MKILFTLGMVAALVISAGCAQTEVSEANNQETEEEAVPSPAQNNGNNNKDVKVQENEEHEENSTDNIINEADDMENHAENNEPENETTPLTSADFDIPDVEYIYQEIPHYEWMKNDNYESEISEALAPVDPSVEVDVSGREIIDYYPDFQEIAMEMENGYFYNGLGDFDLIRHGDGFVSKDGITQYSGVFENDVMIFGYKNFLHNEDSPATSRYMMRGEFEEPHLHGDGVSYFPHNDLVNYIGTFQQGIPHTDTAEYQAMRCDNGQQAGEMMNDRCYGLAYFGDFTEVDWEYDLQITNISREGSGASFYILTGEALGVEPLAGESAGSPFPNSQVHSFSDGSVEYYGEWVYDKYHGIGTYFYPDGQAKLHGEFYEGLPHGEAVHFSEGGEVIYHGNYDMGKPVEDEEAFYFEQEDLSSESLKYRTFLDPQLDH